MRNFLSQILLDLYAKKIGSHHYDIKVNIDDMLGHVENIANIVDEPFSNSSIAK